MDLAQVVPYALAQAKWLGPALLAAGAAVRIVGKAIGRALLFAGILASSGLALQEWQAVHSLLLSGGILVLGVAVFGLLGWTVRGLSLLFAFVLVAAAFYLILFGWAGPSFAGTPLGSVTWAAATIVTMVATGFRGGMARAAVPGLGMGPIP